MILPRKASQPLGGERRVLLDTNSTGKERPWKVVKQFSQYLAEAYLYLDQKKRSERVSNCASYLLFLECLKSGKHPKKLVSANFCQDRLCPTCQKRKSIIQFKTSVQIGHELLRRHPNYEFIFLTLTVPNVQLDDLSKTITHILESWHRLIKRTEFKKAIKGYLRTLEITYNHKRDDWHPHIHAALVVSSRYFKTKDYIKRDRWLLLWQEVTGQPEITQVDIRKLGVKKKKKEENSERNKGFLLIKEFAELSKYAVKEWSTASKQSTKNLMKKGEISRDIEGHTWLRKTVSETASVVEKLQSALYGRRLVQTGGILADIKRELKLKDAEDKGIDLVNTSGNQTTCQCDICGGDMEKVGYAWKKSLADYFES